MIHAVVHQPVGFAARSGLLPLVEAVGARVLNYDVTWEQVMERSWTAGQMLRSWGIRHYGSAWNALVPYRDEWRLARSFKGGAGDVVHFLWGEFAAPRHPTWFNKRGAKLVGTFHCSARRFPSVLAGYTCLDSFDRISVMSKSQIPWLVSRSYPSAKIDVTLHGVDTAHYTPGAAQPSADGPLRLLLVGYTERDHEFAAAVMRSLAGEPVVLDVASSESSAPNYAGATNVRLLPRLGDADLIAAYRSADLLFMPLLDCTANNAVLEAMACGTPVMANDVGGIREYADNGTNLILPGKDVAVWRAQLLELSRERGGLHAVRAATRGWAEEFSWSAVAPQFHAFYARALEN